MEAGTSVTVQELKDGPLLRSLMVKNLSSGATEELAPGGAFICIGLNRNSDFLKGNVETDPRGFITIGGLWRGTGPGSSPRTRGLQRP